MTAPEHIVIVGAGVFGLSTAHALSHRPFYRSSKITLIAPHSSQELIGSVDTSRIVRSDYSDPVYASLGAEALEHWRGAFGQEGRYNQVGLLLTADKTGRQDAIGYVTGSLDNVRALNATAGGRDDDLVEADSREQVSKLAGGSAKASGDYGYVNYGSGWGNAGASIRYLCEIVEKEGRVKFLDVTVKRLVVSHDGAAIDGVELETGEIVHAGLTIVAAGAWTSSLVDLRGRASARGQGLMYVSLSEQEALEMKDVAVHLNLNSGMLYCPPVKNASGEWELKMMQHSFGYQRMAKVQDSITEDGRCASFQVSQPWFPDDLPQDAKELYMAFLQEAFPHIAASLDQRKVRTRLCWYLDTVSSDWIICNHPTLKSLFLATAGSGHGFKFLPIIGEKIVDLIHGLPGTEALQEKWKWPARESDDEVWSSEASRGGSKGHSISI